MIISQLQTAMQSVERWMHGADGLFFGRMSNGNVLIVKTDGPLPPHCTTDQVKFSQEVNDGHWGSIVLTMTEFNERSNDWYPFMDHHHGRRDILAAAK